MINGSDDLWAGAPAVPAAEEGLGAAAPFHHSAAHDGGQGYFGSAAASSSNRSAAGAVGGAGAYSAAAMSQDSPPGFGDGGGSGNAGAAAAAPMAFAPQQGSLAGSSVPRAAQQAHAYGAVGGASAAAALAAAAAAGGGAGGGAAEEEDDGDRSRKGDLKKDLPPSAVKVLKAWLLSEEHFHKPYPTTEEKLELVRRTGIQAKQLTNWFTNARKRIWQPRYGPTPKSKRGDGDIGSAEAAEAAAGAAAAAAAAAAGNEASERKRCLTPVTAPLAQARQQTAQSFAMRSPKVAKLHAGAVVDGSTLSPPSMPLVAPRAIVPDPELQLFEFNDVPGLMGGGHGAKAAIPSAASELLFSISPVGALDESMFSEPYSWLESTSTSTACES